MQRLSELTQADLAQLDDEQVEALIELEAAHRGVPYPPPRPLSPTEQEPKPSTTVYVVGGFEMTDGDEAQQLAEYIRGLDSTVDLQYASGPSYKQYVSDKEPSVDVSTKMAYTKAEYEQYRGLLSDLGRTKEKYQSALKDYESATTLWDAVAEEVNTAVFEAQEHERRRTYLRGKHERYLTLAEGDQAVARTFFLDAYPGCEWALDEDAS